MSNQIDQKKFSVRVYPLNNLKNTCFQRVVETQKIRFSQTKTLKNAGITYFIIILPLFNFIFC